MFDLQCMQYLKGLEENPQNIELRNQFSQLLNQNKDKIDSFIEQFQLSPQQKQLLLEVMQESSTQNINTQLQNANSTKNLNNDTISSTDSFYDLTIEYFNNWREEYFKLRSVSPKCIETVDKYISEILMNNDNNYLQEVVDNFEALPTQQNDAFLKFKNHVRNIMVANLIDRLNQEITVVKTNSIPFFKKYKLLFEIERIQRNVANLKLNISKYNTVLNKSKNIRGVN